MTRVATHPAAFFDVDETLLTVKSIFRFLAFVMDAQGRPRSDYHRAAHELRSLAAAGASRQQVGRVYFQRFAGLDEGETAALGGRWFEAERRRGSVFNPAVLAAFREHAAAGHLTVLVSGSFSACLDPIGRFLRADGILCSRPEVRECRYTGLIAVPMIGEAKASAVRTWASARGVDLGSSHAYGDHASDLPVLSLVGRPVVVGDDPVLAGHATRHGWAQMPGANAT